MRLTELMQPSPRMKRDWWLYVGLSCYLLLTAVLLTILWIIGRTIEMNGR